MHVAGLVLTHAVMLTVSKHSMQAKKLRLGSRSLTPGDEDAEAELRFLGFLLCHSRRIEDHLERLKKVFLPQIVEPAE